MSISSRTPEGLPSRCPICGAVPNLELSEPAGDAPCPNCGCLVWHDGEVVVRPPGPILTPEALEEAMAGLARWVESEERPRVRFDLQDVDYISSAALGKLINLKKPLQRRRGTIRFANMNPDLQEIFRITRLDQVPGFEF
jgi:anti-sigma B factor antagonist